MPQLALSLASIQELDNGRMAAAFEQELKRAVADCKDRASNKSPRTVTLKIKLVPFDNGGDCETVYVGFDCDTKLPPKKTRDYPMLCHHNGQLSFSTTSPDNPRQKTFDDAEDETAAGKSDGAQKGGKKKSK